MEIMMGEVANNKTPDHSIQYPKGMSVKRAMVQLGVMCRSLDISDEEVKQVWTSFMDRCSISMTEPDTQDWTPEMFQLYDTLWLSEMNPF